MEIGSIGCYAGYSFFLCEGGNAFFINGGRVLSSPLRLPPTACIIGKCEDIFIYVNSYNDVNAYFQSKKYPFSRDYRPNYYDFSDNKIWYKLKSGFHSRVVHIIGSRIEKIWVWLEDGNVRQFKYRGKFDVEEEACKFINTRAERCRKIVAIANWTNGIAFLKKNGDIVYKTWHYGSDIDYKVYHYRLGSTELNGKKVIDIVAALYEKMIFLCDDMSFFYGGMVAKTNGEIEKIIPLKCYLPGFVRIRNIALCVWDNLLFALANDGSVWVLKFKERERGRRGKGDCLTIESNFRKINARKKIIALKQLKDDVFLVASDGRVYVYDYNDKEVIRKHKMRNYFPSVKYEWMEDARYVKTQIMPPTSKIIGWIGDEEDDELIQLPLPAPLVMPLL